MRFVYIIDNSSLKDRLQMIAASLASIVDALTYLGTLTLVRTDLEAYLLFVVFSDDD